MPPQHSKLTIVSMAVIASASATLLHEGLGHGVTAWLRGDVVTALTSNHLSALTADRWVDAAGTLVNLAAGAIALLASCRAGTRENLRYFLWLLAAFNLLPGTGYFLYSGIFGVGDWYAIIRGLPHPFALRFALTILGAALYVGVVRLLARALRPFVPGPSAYNTIGRLPYLAAGLFSCLAGLFDPLGLKLFLLATVAAAFGGSSGLLWADVFLPRNPSGPFLSVRRSLPWPVTALVLGTAFIAILGRGLSFNH